MEYWKKIKKLKPDSEFYTLAITAFEEHLPDGPDALIKAIKFMNSSRCQIIAIFHNKSQGKPHYHVLVRMSDPDDRMVVSTILRHLHIQFRAGIDDNFINARALETCGSFPHYATYLLHKTAEARLEGKAEYKKTDYITNLTPSDIDKTLDGYTIKSIKITKKNMPYLIDQAHQSGLEQKSFSEFMDNAHILWPSQSDENKLRKAHESGLVESLKKNGDQPKLCIQISESYTEELKAALQSVFSDSSVEFSTSTGKFNTIDSCTNALVISLRDMPERIYTSDIFRTLCDPTNHMIQAPFLKKSHLWIGDIIILIDYTHTSEDPKTKKTKEYIKTKSSYCFSCIIKKNKLKCVGTPTAKMSDTNKQTLIKRFTEFNKALDTALAMNEKTSIISLEDLQ